MLEGEGFVLMLRSALNEKILFSAVTAFDSANDSFRDTKKIFPSHTADNRNEKLPGDLSSQLFNLLCGPPLCLIIRHLSSKLFLSLGSLLHNLLYGFLSRRLLNRDCFGSLLCG
jgi:hypothetical protein